MNAILESKIKQLSQLNDDLQYWDNKPDTFWLTWKGHPKSEIIADKKAYIAKLEKEISYLSNH